MAQERAPNAKSLNDAIGTTLDAYKMNKDIIGEILNRSTNVFDQRLARSIENYTSKLGAAGKALSLGLSYAADGWPGVVGGVSGVIAGGLVSGAIAIGAGLAGGFLSAPVLAVGIVSIVAAGVFGSLAGSFVSGAVKDALKGLIPQEPPPNLPNPVPRAPSIRRPARAAWITSPARRSPIQILPMRTIHPMWHRVGSVTAGDPHGRVRRQRLGRRSLHRCSARSECRIQQRRLGRRSLHEFAHESCRRRVDRPEPQRDDRAGS